MTELGLITVKTVWQKFSVLDQSISHAARFATLETTRQQYRVTEAASIHPPDEELSKKAYMLDLTYQQFNFFFIQ